MKHNVRTIALTLMIMGVCPSPTLARGSSPDPVQVAAQTLNLQPGDAELMRQAAQHPIPFQEIKGSREFRGELIVHARKGKVATAEARVEPLTLRRSSMVPERVVRVPDGMTEGELAAMLMATGDYEFVEPNWTLFPAVVPNDSQYGNSWQHNRLQSASAWDIETGDSSVIVAVCDSGVDLDHPDLQDALVPGYNAATGRPQSNGGEVDDINGHGTFVAGCAAAQGNNGIGVVGAGWDFSIMPVRVTNNTDGTAGAFAILEGARWAAEQGAQIINASFTGGTSGSNQSAARYIKQQGGLLFWAAGNDSAYIEPNRPDYVIVSSTTSSDNRSGFSNYGPAVDVAAPGSSVRSTRRGGSYGNGSGTSYASPIAAGVGAMIFSANPELTPDDVQDILYQSVDDLGASGRDDFFGRGRVNTYKAVQLALSYQRPTVLPVSNGFEDASWQELFAAAGGSPQPQSVSQAPQGVSVLRLEPGDEIVTEALAGRTLYDDAMISFAARAENIEGDDALLVQYLENPETAGDDSWATIVSIDERGRVNDEFVRFNIPLPNDLQWHGVRVRFLAEGDDGDDAWLVDDFSIDLVPEPEAPLIADFESQHIDPVFWKTTTNTDPVYRDGTFAARIADNGTLQSFEFSLLQFGFVRPYFLFDAWKDESVGDDDTLTVEVFTVSNVWEAVAELTGADLSETPQRVEIDMPVYTWALDDMKVRFRADTEGGFLLDNIYLGVDEPNDACSPADLAEPFGELDFFDVSAFLTAFNAGDPAADVNGDGVMDFFDVSAFLTELNAGCP